MGNAAKQCRLGLFQDSDFAGDLEDSNPLLEEHYAIFGSHTIVPISWTCEKQTTVSNSSTESASVGNDTKRVQSALCTSKNCFLSDPT